MASVKDATIEAFNAYISTLKQGGGNIRFSLVQFDSYSVETPVKDTPILAVPELTDATYVPRGGTPLIDAAYKTIQAAERKAEELGPGAKVVICIQTDGEENSSREYTWDQLNDLIKAKMAAGWQFNFMGVGMDAYRQAKRMGVSAGQTMSYDINDRWSTRSAFAAQACNTVAYASGMSGSTEYTAKQRMDAGDVGQPAAPPPALPAKQASGKPTDPFTKAQLKRAGKLVDKIVDEVTL